MVVLRDSPLLGGGAGGQSPAGWWWAARVTACHSFAVLMANQQCPRSHKVFTLSRQILEQITAEEIIQYKTFQSEDLHQLVQLMKILGSKRLVLNEDPRIETSCIE